MDPFTKKTFTTARGLAYAFYDSSPNAPHSASLPTILLLHGYPDSARIWSEVAPRLLPLRARIIVPDLLGYGDTDKPTDPAAYDSESMAGDVAELLAATAPGRCVAVGHDWGSFLAQRLHLWHPAAVAGLAMVNVAYMAPFPTPLDLAALDPRWSYWGFYAGDGDAAAVCAAHAESLWCAIHAASDDVRRALYSTPGALRRFLEADGACEVRAYGRLPAHRDPRAEWLARMRAGGFEGPLCWYKAVVGGFTPAVEAELAGRDPGRLVVRVPALFVGATGDQICSPDAIREPWARGLLPDLQIKMIDGFHRPMLENPEQLALFVAHWLIEKLGFPPGFAPDMYTAL
ncbi:hypothetical protein SLS58_010762 [Diplodia intermedia]|uniref:AB hydrolase-1 domain-containing protein n=1 Tax=Diplodia intermedia TaxID=856260 RepID=A0ABR3T437_9PEZI